MTQLADNLCGAFISTVTHGLNRASAKKCSIWAEQYRKIKGKPWSFRLRPWTKEMHDSTATHNIGQKAAQMAYTETVLNKTFHAIDVNGYDVLYVLPSQQPDAKDFSVTRFDPAINESEHLSQIFSSVQNVGLKQARTGCVYIRGSRSRSQLKSIPVAFLVLDEVDEFSEEAIALATERLSGQETRQEWDISTPSIPDRGINQLYQASTQEHFFFTCPYCNRHTELTFPESLVITAEHHLEKRVEDSHIICKECKHILPHEDKPTFLANGQWQSTDNLDASTRGFYINQLYSSTVTPADIATKYLKSFDSIVAEQEFYNSKIGVPHIPKGSQITDENINALLGDFKNGDNRFLSGFLTMGVDVGTFLHVSIMNWTFDHSPGNINAKAIGRLAYCLKVETFQELYDLVIQFKPQAGVIDAHPEKRLALDFIRQFPGVFYVCFYGNKQQKNEINGTDEAVTVDRTTWLDSFLGRFKNGRIRLPKDLSLEYREHIKAMIRTPKKDEEGNIYFKYLKSKADHYAHSGNYAEIALRITDGFGAHETVDW